LAAALGARVLCRRGAQELGLTLVSEKTGTERSYRITVKNPARKSKGRRKAA
jgi:hypothetical protein